MLSSPNHYTEDFAPTTFYTFKAGVTIHDPNSAIDTKFSLYPSSKENNLKRLKKQNHEFFDYSSKSDYLLSRD